jgi:Uma2 family endonuclease
MRLGILLGRYVLDNHLGEVFAAETGFILSRRPDTVRAPDVSFVARDRLPEGELPADYMEVVPDLAVEVVSPNDRAREVREKTEDWLGAGVPLVWVINPATRSVTVHETLEDFEELSETGILDGGQVLPGFICEINKLFS